MSVVLLVMGLVLFAGLVLIHEWGHFIMAKRNGVEVEEFALFFGPALYQKKTKSGWIFSIRAFPLGGFVRLKGEHDSDTAKGSFGAASTWAKTKIMAAGVVMNLLVALVLFTILALIGMPKLIDNQFTVKRDTQLVNSEVLIAHVEAGSPAAKAGLKARDQITDIAIEGRSPVAVTSADKLPDITRQFAGKSVNIYYVRDGRTEIGKTTLLSTKTVEQSRHQYDQDVQNTKLDCESIDPPKGYLGISPVDYTVQRSTWSAPVVAVGFSGQVTGLTFQGLGHAVAGLGKLVTGFVTQNSVARQNGQCAASSQVAGPVGIFFILKDGSNLGLQYILLIIAIISLTLAIMNILPIPALDGGRLWLTLGFRLFGKQVSAKTEELVNAIGFIVLLGLVVLITLVDVHRFF